jgi:hypothetical protein
MERRVKRRGFGANFNVFRQFPRGTLPKRQIFKRHPQHRRSALMGFPHSSLQLTVQQKLCAQLG